MIVLNSSAPALILPPFNIALFILATWILNLVVSLITLSIISSLIPNFFIDEVKSWTTFLLNPSKNICPFLTASFVFNINSEIILDAVLASVAVATFCVFLEICFKDSFMLFPKSSDVTLRAALSPSNFLTLSNKDWDLKLLDLKGCDIHLSIHRTIWLSLNALNWPLVAIKLPIFPKPITAGIIGKPYSAPNNNLFCSCLPASSAPLLLLSLSNPVPKKLNNSISPNVPMLSSSATNIPTPAPPPTVIPINLSNLESLLSWSVFFIPSTRFFVFLVVLRYLPPLIAWTNLGASSLAFWDILATIGTAVFCAILPAPTNCTNASVILPTAVSLAWSSDCDSIIPK